MSKIEDENVRFFFGEPYIIDKKTKEFPLDPCSGGGKHVVEYEVVKYHPDIFGMMHLQGTGMRALTINRVRITRPPELVSTFGEVSVALRVRIGLIFSFSSSPDVKYKLSRVKHIRHQDVRLVFRRLDGEELTPEELEIAKFSKHIHIKNGL